MNWEKSWVSLVLGFLICRMGLHPTTFPGLVWSFDKKAHEAYPTVPLVHSRCSISTSMSSPETVHLHFTCACSPTPSSWPFTQLSARPHPAWMSCSGFRTICHFLCKKFTRHRVVIPMICYNVTAFKFSLNFWFLQIPASKWIPYKFSFSWK